jgi:hypothetical protein
MMGLFKSEEINFWLLWRPCESIAKPIGSILKKPAKECLLQALKKR